MPVTDNQTIDLLRARNSAVSRGVVAAHPVFIARAHGSHVWDVDGREYLDFVAGIGVLNVGHNHPRVVAAAREQLEAYTHTCFQVAMYEPYIRLAERLSLLVGRGRPTKAFLATTGAEAVENAIKIARAATGRAAVVTFDGAFHGRTLLAMTLTGMSAPYKQNFGPFAPEIYRSPYPYEYRGWTADRALQALRELFATTVSADRVAAILIEPQLGDGGFVPAPAAFLRALRKICDQHGIVLICDEIQTGFGRTGRMFGYEHAGIAPDLVTLAKGLANGFPVSAVVGAARLMDAPEPGGLGGTYGGNPIACAAALAVLDIFEHEHIIERAEALGAILREGLSGLLSRYPQIGDVRGLGAMVGCELVKDRTTREPAGDLTSAIIDEARNRGLLVIRCGLYRNVIRMLPPLTATENDARRAVRLLDEAIGHALVNRRTSCVE